MSAADTPAEEPPKKRSRLPLLVGLVLAVALGGGGFYAAYSGLLPFGGGKEEAHASVPPSADVAFVPIPPLIVSLGAGASGRHLRFSAELEVPTGQQAEVAKLMPRVLDVLNGYLRAVDNRQFEEPAALIRLRAQMLRRVQIVLGEGRVRDLLVTEFVVN